MATTILTSASAFERLCAKTGEKTQECSLKTNDIEKYIKSFADGKISYEEVWVMTPKKYSSCTADIYINGTLFEGSSQEEASEAIKKEFQLAKVKELPVRKAKPAAPSNPEIIPATAIKNLITMTIASKHVKIEEVLENSEIPLNPLTLQVIINQAVSKALPDDELYYKYLDEIKAEAQVFKETVEKFSELKALPLEDYKPFIEVLNKRNLW